MTVIVAHVGHGSNPLASSHLLGSHRHRAQLLIIGDGLGDILRHNALMLAIDGDRHVVAHIDLGTLGHRLALGIGPRALGLTARRELPHASAVSLLALLESRELFLKLCACGLMDTGFLTIGCIQIAHVLRHLLIEILERLRKCCLRDVLVFALDGRELTFSDGQEFCPIEIPWLAPEDNIPDEGLKRVGVMFSEISHGREIGSQLARKPDELHVAMGFPLQPSARSAPVEVSIDVEREHIPWIIGWSTRECGVSPRDSKTLEIETLHLRITETNRMICSDRVIDHIGQKPLVGSAVSRHVSHPASLLCIGGRFSWSVRSHKTFSHSLALQRTGWERGGSHVAGTVDRQWQFPRPPLSVGRSARWGESICSTDSLNSGE
jgi:hypothetical protein